MESGSNYLTLFFVFLALFSFFFYIFYANPYHVLNFARIPMMILCIVIVLGFFIFIEYYIAHVIFQKDTSRELWINFTRYTYKYFYYLFYILCISILAYIAFKALEKGLVFTFNYSFWISVGLLILFLAFINSFDKKISFNNPTVELIKNIIMYIPCLITDAIEFIKKDYKDTPSTVFVVFLFLVFYITVFYLVPFFHKQQYKNDGFFLVEKSLPLNTDVLSITSSALNEKIKEKRPFYDKWFQNIIELETQTPRSKINIQTTQDSSLNLLVPPDYITLPYYLKQIENFTSIQNDDSNALTNIIPVNVFKKRTEEYDSLDNSFSPEEYNKRIKQFVSEHPQILTLFEKAQYIYAGAFASWDSFKSLPHLLVGNKNKVSKYNYHYAITAWVYLQQVESTQAQVIYSFGSRPSLYYDPVDATLMIALNYGKTNQKILYKTSSILYQRWNFIVMNYKYGTLDLFINNNLVGTYPDVLTNLDEYDVLLVGSRDNKNVGGICNMKYYELPLNLRKINDIYKTFHNKKIPL